MSHSLPGERYFSFATDPFISFFAQQSKLHSGYCITIHKYKCEILFPLYVAISFCTAFNMCAYHLKMNDNRRLSLMRCEILSYGKHYCYSYNVKLEILPYTEQLKLTCDRKLFLYLSVLTEYIYCFLYIFTNIWNVDARKTKKKKIVERKRISRYISKEWHCSRCKINIPRNGCKLRALNN